MRVCVLYIHTPVAGRFCGGGGGAVDWSRRRVSRLVVRKILFVSDEEMFQYQGHAVVVAAAYGCQA